MNPLTARKLRRFRSIRRGWWSFLLLALLLLISLAAELLVNSRALIVSHQGRLYFPTYAANIPGTTFGLPYSYETNYRQLQQKFRDTPGGADWVLLPPVPYNPYENDFQPGLNTATPPSLAQRHPLGTDTTRRDILARLLYGFRISFLAALAILAGTYLIGITLGCAMGYFGGWFDLIGQRLIEIWTNIPFLYAIIILASLIRPNIGLLLLIFIAFDWPGMTTYMRTSAYREKSRDYVAAALTLGASTPRIILHHILPNILSTLVTFIPFTISGAITSLTALDFIGYGLPPPTPSWGELMAQGVANLDAPWILCSVFIGMTSVLILVTFIGEAIREAFDPKKFTTYQ